MLRELEGKNLQFKGGKIAREIESKSKRDIEL